MYLENFYSEFLLRDNEGGEREPVTFSVPGWVQFSVPSYMKVGKVSPLMFQCTVHRTYILYHFSTPIFTLDGIIGYVDFVVCSQKDSGP